MDAYYILGGVALISFSFILSLIMDSIYSVKDPEVVYRKIIKKSPVNKDYENYDVLIDE